MKRNPQRGMTLVELLVAMALTSILLVGLNDVFLTVTRHYQQWSTKIQNASIGAVLLANLSADTHRYAVCASPDQYTLDLCSIDDIGGAPAVEYKVSATAPYIVTRQPLQRASNHSVAFMARSQTGQRPYFAVDCSDAGSVVSGDVAVYNLRANDGAGGTAARNLMVYFTAPWTQSCGP